MRKKLKNSLFLKLTSLAALIMVLLIAAFILTNWYVGKSLRENTLEMNDKIILQVKSKIDEYYNTINHVGTTLVYSPTIYEYFRKDAVNRVISNEDVSSVFLNTVLLENDITGIYLYDADMTQIAGMGKYTAEIETLDFIRSKKSKMEFSNIFYLNQMKTPHYVVYVPVFNLKSLKYGEQIGMGTLIMKTGHFNTFLEDTQAMESTEVYIVDGNDKIVADRGNREFERLERSMMKSNEEYYVQIHELKMDGWRIVSRIPVADLQSSSIHYQGILLTAYALAVILAGMLIYFCYQHLIMPIRQMDDFVKGVISNPERRMQTGREDEIGTVVASLNQMLDEKEQMSKRIQESQKQMYEAKLSEKQLQVLAYRNQINPHFLYNTFDCIRAMALYYGVDGIAEITLALSKVFRFGIKGDNIVTVEEEVDYVKEYARIIEYRFVGKIEVNINVDEEVRKKKVIKLILQPLVENAVFHGLEQRIEEGEVTVAVRMKDAHRILFEVTDNGCGIPEKTLEGIRKSLDSQESKKGIGMANIYQRLKLFYGEGFEFLIQSKENAGTTITLIIPDEIQEDKGQYV